MHAFIEEKYFDEIKKIITKQNEFLTIYQVDLV